MSVEEAAKIIGINQQALRMRIQQGYYPEWAKLRKNSRGSGFRYSIIRANFYNYFGVKEKEQREGGYKS